MKIVIIGGTGLVGSQLTNRLRDSGNEVIPASPSTGVNTLTGEGLSNAFKGAQVVVDVSNSPSFDDTAVMKFFETSTQNILAAEKAANVQHHVALSVVGTERLQASGYFRAKLAQEALIKASSVPYTIMRSTQFFEFVSWITQSATEGQTVRVSPALIQPIASADVAKALVDVVLGQPQNGTVEVAGPEKFRLDELVRTFLNNTKDSRTVVSDPHALYSGVELNNQSLTPSAGARIAPTKYISEGR